MRSKATTEWSENSLNPRQFFRLMIRSEKSFLWAEKRSQRSGQCPFVSGDLRILSLRFSLRTGLQPDGWWGLCPQTPEVYPLWEYPVKIKKSCNISVTALHRFFPQPASGRCLALPCLDCIFSMVRILVIIAFTRFDFQNRKELLISLYFVIFEPVFAWIYNFAPNQISV